MVIRDQPKLSDSSLNEELPKINLHIHSDYSDGKNSLKKIVKSAIKFNFDFITITDHLSNSWKSNIIQTLDTHQKIKRYLGEISFLNQSLIETKKGLRVLKGVEIDLSSSFDYITELVKPNEFDIILFEYLENPESIEFVDRILRYWKNESLISGKFPILGLAHFDPSTFIHYGYDSLLKFMQANQIYYELNSRYSEFYSSRYKESLFDKIRDNGILVGIGTDSHKNDSLDNIQSIIEVISYYNLKENLRNLIERIADNFKDTN
ncbi:MAG: PHP domain-containing protein [Candidatus Lokiarchaeota archaeon]|nr:PHP domain-containing protein [Candidatus Lokiarchaeota archaeon]MBD3199520.1 PHP domain-containing protein [Candidatus Lokiarchaeota archaeon]